MSAFVPAQPGNDATRRDPVSAGLSGPFHSIVFPGPQDLQENPEPPDCLHDLNLDQLVADVVAGREACALAPLFYTRLDTVDAVVYRQDIMRDLEDPPRMRAITVFAQHMRDMRESLESAGKSHCPHEAERWFLDAVMQYRAAVENLLCDLDASKPRASGLRALCDYLRNYLALPAYREWADEVDRLVSALADIRYNLLIHGRTVTVRAQGDEPDSRIAVEATFERFRRGATQDYRRHAAGRLAMDQVQEQILERVALLYPDTFAALTRFREQHADFANATIVKLDREVQFYVAWLEYIRPCCHQGLEFCYPELSDADKEVAAEACFDLALAHAGTRIVGNDFHLAGRERTFVVSGPNQGGKTTFARTFGQLHYLASLGCKVPGKRASLFLCDNVFTHFERAENVGDLRGKLNDELVRMRGILSRATPSSVVIINEMFASTTLDDAMWLGRKIMQRIDDLGALCVCVTFIEELSVFSEHSVSMVAAVDPHDPTIRTFRVERRAADGLAYAQAIAGKHRVTRAWLRRRLVG